MASIPEISNILLDYIKQIFSTTVVVSKFLIQFVLAFIICFYILLDKEVFLSFIKKKITFITLSKNNAYRLINLCKTLNSNIGRYL